jgi:hypothetical protein
MNNCSKMDVRRVLCLDEAARIQAARRIAKFRKGHKENDEFDEELADMLAQRRQTVRAS